MLARRNRLTRGAEYKSVVRRGRRCASAHTVMYVLTAPVAVSDAAVSDAAAIEAAASDGVRGTRFGFIVSKQVGSAVVRNTVRRRLKAVCLEALPSVRPGTEIVIRALPSAATAGFTDLRAEVTRCLARRAA